MATATKNPAAAALGKIGGRSRSAKKLAAVKRNLAKANQALKRKRKRAA